MEIEAIVHDKRRIKLKESWLLPAAILYIYIPFFIFMVGFTRPLVWIVVLTGVSFVLLRVFSAIKQQEFAINEINVKPAVIVTGVIFLLIVGYFACWGRWVKQPFDWYKHNAVLKDLVGRPWPVYYKNGDERSMLTYYVGQYMVPALIGKGLNSYRIAEIMIYVWNEIGLIMVWLYFLVYMKDTKALTQLFGLFCLIFFHTPQSLAEIIAYLFAGVDNLFKNSFTLYNDEIIIQYSGNFGILKWVFPQVIVPWLVIIIFLNNKDKIKFYLTYMLPMLLFAVFPLVGMIPLAVGYYIYSCFRAKTAKRVKEVFSKENILSVFFVGVPLILYYYGNVFSPKPERVSFRFLHYGEHFDIFLIFIFCNIVIYSICIWGENKKNPLYYISVVYLLVLPLFSMGYYNDLVMRTSIPALFVLMVLVCKYIAGHVQQFWKSLKEIKKGKPRIRELTFIISFVILIGVFVNAIQYQLIMFDSRIFNEDYTSVAEEKTYGTLEYFANRELAVLNEQGQRELLEITFSDISNISFPIDEDLVFNYFSYDIDNNFFCNRLAKRNDYTRK